MVAAGEVDVFLVEDGCPLETSTCYPSVSSTILKLQTNFGDELYLPCNL